jgi:capsular exopolysaccharide synthesis family protein
MGRIAEALRKAQQERTEKLRLHFCEASGQHSPSAVLLPVAEDGGASPAATAGASQPAGGTILGELNLDTRQDRLGLLEDSSSGSPVTAVGIKKSRPAAGLGPVPEWDIHPSVVAVGERNSSITEQYRAVRTWLLRQAVGEERTCLAVTSSVAKEGKTLTVANLAVVLAEVRHLKILAVDVDFRRSQLAGLLKLPNSPGLADVITNRTTLDEAIHSTPLGNLSIVPAGNCQDVNPAEIINSTALARAFEEFRDRYDFVLVDTPPVQRLSDTGVIGALCTGILVVVRMNSTPAPLVQQSVRWLQANNLNVVGCIATCCEAGAAQASYRDAYSYKD